MLACFNDMTRYQQPSTNVLFVRLPILMMPPALVWHSTLSAYEFHLSQSFSTIIQHTLDKERHKLSFQPIFKRVVFYWLKKRLNSSPRCRSHGQDPDGRAQITRHGGQLMAETAFSKFRFRLKNIRLSSGCS